MIQAGWIVLVEVLVLSGSLLAGEAGSGMDSKIAKNFKVRWSSIRYDKAVMVENPEIAKTAEQKSETLTLSCHVEISDPNLILGVGQGGVVTQLTDGGGRDVAVNATPAARSTVNAMPGAQSRQMYESLRYHQKFGAPPAVPKWREIIRTILHRPSGPSGPPQMVRELQPSQITMRLDMGLLDQAGGELRSVKGYFYALVAGSIEHVEVPFEPNNTWVRLTPDTEIQVAEATRGGSSFQYRIDVRPQGGRMMRPLSIGDFLPARMVVAQQFIGEDGKPLGFPGGMGSVMPRVGGRGSHSGGNSRVKTIRFVIVVDPKEYKIPFEVKRIPLPKP